MDLPRPPRLQPPSDDDPCPQGRGLAGRPLRVAVPVLAAPPHDPGRRGRPLARLENCPPHHGRYGVARDRTAPDPHFGISRQHRPRHDLLRASLHLAHRTRKPDPRRPGVWSGDRHQAGSDRPDPVLLSLFAGFSAPLGFFLRGWANRSRDLVSLRVSGPGPGIHTGTDLWVPKPERPLGSFIPAPPPDDIR